jgi:hypothetical protein
VGCWHEEEVGDEEEKCTRQLDADVEMRHRNAHSF